MAMDFVTGLVVGRNEAAAVSREWADYAEGLEQDLERLRIRRAKNCSDIAGLMAVLHALPQEMVLDAMNKHYGDAYLQCAISEFGLDPTYANSCMNATGQETWQELAAPRPTR